VSIREHTRLLELLTGLLQSPTGLTGLLQGPTGLTGLLKSHRRTILSLVKDL
jgi:hypothetical protein